MVTVQLLILFQLRPLVRPRLFHGARDVNANVEPVLQAQAGVGRDVVDGRNGPRHRRLLQHLPHGIQVNGVQVYEF